MRILREIIETNLIDDVLVILGDAGINFYGKKKDTQPKKQLSTLPITLLCIHGNHEMRPESLGGYREREWHGGEVHVEDPYPSLLFAKDGEIYDLGGNRCVAIGGAYSVDKPYRIANGWGWWPDEQADGPRKLLYIESQLEKAGWDVDAVLAHTCPKHSVPIEVFSPDIDQSTVDDSMEWWLDVLSDRLRYTNWHCGHWHTDKTMGKVRFMFTDFIELRQKAERRA